ncbi:MAG TPA: hypothetical protein VGD17_17890 [Chitinophagaceae bacterium]
MKQLNSKALSTAVKAILGLSAFCFLSLFFMSMKIKKFNDELWKQLGITQPDANRNILNSFNQGHFMYYGAKYAKTIASGNRVKIVNELGAYAKKYAASEEFKREYAANRARRKPAEPGLIEISPEEIRAEEKARIEQAIKLTEANANHPNPKVRNGVPYRLEALKKELSTIDDPNNRTVKMKIDNANRSNEQAKKMHTAAMQKFETEYPENPQPIIKKRLQQILDITADVDYEAELKEAYGKKVFVNPVYEKKPMEWKLAYRSGKAATDAVRAFAEKWMKELN